MSDVSMSYPCAFFFCIACLFQECIDRGESRMNADFNDEWSLVLINWIGTAGNPLSPCLNSLKELTAKLTACYSRFGRWTNFLAVDYYSAGSEGGAFKAVKWLNQKWKGEQSRCACSFLRFVSSDVKR